MCNVDLDLVRMAWMLTRFVLDHLASSASRSLCCACSVTAYCSLRLVCSALSRACRSPGRPLALPSALGLRSGGHTGLKDFTGAEGFVDMCGVNGVLGKH